MGGFVVQKYLEAGEAAGLGKPQPAGEQKREERDVRSGTKAAARRQQTGLAQKRGDLFLIEEIAAE